MEFVSRLKIKMTDISYKAIPFGMERLVPVLDYYFILSVPEGDLVRI